jgi:tripartite-type tricarboxylate transporter receptor subunit TctC
MMVSKLWVMDFQWFRECDGRLKHAGWERQSARSAHQPSWRAHDGDPASCHNLRNKNDRENAMTLRRLVLAAFASLFAPLAAQAQYPDRQITMVVCFPAGGGTDIAARIINTPLGEALGKPVIIENRGGAGGNIATTAVARMAADGYTLLVCSSAFVVNPSLYASATYDPLKDFVPLMVIGASPNVFVVPAQSPIQSMKEFLEKAKAADGKMNWTSSGVGTTPQLTGELIQIRTGIKMQHVPYAGAGPATTAALGGQVDLYTANIGSLQALIDAGKLRAVAVTSKKRWPGLPNVPTLEEAGIKDVESDTFQGIYVRAGTPQPIVDRLAKELTAILNRPDIKDKYDKVGLPVVAEGPVGFRKRVEREVPMYKEVINKARLRIP